MTLTTISQIVVGSGLSQAEFSCSEDAGAADVDLLVANFGTAEIRYDLTNDGQVNNDDQAFWVHDSSVANTYFGDANLDGEFNSTDIVDVFAAGEYEDDITANSTWARGDWNGDGDFGSSDLITAFQDGGYEPGPRSALRPYRNRQVAFC